MERTLHLAEIVDGTGHVRCRYARVPSEAGWVRHGLFVAYHDNGNVAQEGEYQGGLEFGHWREFHESGQLAAEGDYLLGRETGRWQFYDERGLESEVVDYQFGKRV